MNEHKVTSEKQKLINIIIECVKEDINSGVDLFDKKGNTRYMSRISLKALRSITAKKEYGSSRRKRLQFLREHYMHKIKPIYFGNLKK